MTKAVRKSTSRTAAAKRKPRRNVQFLHKPTCATCRKARRFMEKRGIGLRFRNLAKERLSAVELEKLIGKRDHEQFLNPRCSLFRKLKMKDRPPSRRQAITMMAKDPDLIRRPVVVAGGRVVVGYDENGMIRF
jgi:arsenate reductase